MSSLRTLLDSFSQEVLRGKRPRPDDKEEGDCESEVDISDDLDNEEQEGQSRSKGTRQGDKKRRRAVQTCQFTKGLPALPRVNTNDTDVVDVSKCVLEMQPRGLGRQEIQTDLQISQFRMDKLRRSRCGLPTSDSMTEYQTALSLMEVLTPLVIPHSFELQGTEPQFSREALRELMIGDAEKTLLALFDFGEVDFIAPKDAAHLVEQLCSSVMEDGGNRKVDLIKLAATSSLPADEPLGVCGKQLVFYRRFALSFFSYVYLICGEAPYATKMFAGRLRDQVVLQSPYLTSTRAMLPVFRAVDLAATLPSASGSDLPNVLRLSNEPIFLQSIVSALMSPSSSTLERSVTRQCKEILHDLRAFFDDSERNCAPENSCPFVMELYVGYLLGIGKTKKALKVLRRAENFASDVMKTCIAQIEIEERKEYNDDDTPSLLPLASGYVDTLCRCLNRFGGVGEGPSQDEVRLRIASLSVLRIAAFALFSEAEKKGNALRDLITMHRLADFAWKPVISQLALCSSAAVVIECLDGCEDFEAWRVIALALITPEFQNERAPHLIRSLECPPPSWLATFSRRIRWWQHGLLSGNSLETPPFSDDKMRDKSLSLLKGIGVLDAPLLEGANPARNGLKILQKSSHTHLDERGALEYFAAKALQRCYRKGYSYEDGNEGEVIDEEMQSVTQGFARDSKLVLTSRQLRVLTYKTIVACAMFGLDCLFAVRSCDELLYHAASDFHFSKDEQVESVAAECLELLTFCGVNISNLITSGSVQPRQQVSVVAFGKILCTDLTAQVICSGEDLYDRSAIRAFDLQWQSISSRDES